jgi:hypothetical protein
VSLAVPSSTITFAPSRFRTHGRMATVGRSITSGTRSTGRHPGSFGSITKTVRTIQSLVSRPSTGPVRSEPLPGRRCTAFNSSSDRLVKPRSGTWACVRERLDGSIMSSRQPVHWASLCRGRARPVPHREN